MTGKNYNLRRNFRTLLSLIFLDQTCLTITFPLATLIFFDAQTRLFPSDMPLASRSIWYGLCVSLPYFINMFFSPILSALSDEFGRKKILIIEIFSAALFTLFVGLGIYLGKLIFVFIGYLIRGAFSRTNPTALAIIGDIAPRDKKIIYMGYLQFAIAVGAFLGPIAGGYFAHSFHFDIFNFSLPFFLAAVFAVCNGMFAAYFMNETLQNPITRTHHELSWHAIKEVLNHKVVLRISFLLFLIQFCWSSYYQFIPPILKTLNHFDAKSLGFFIGMIAFWLAIATSIGIHWLHRFFNMQQMLLFALYFILLGFAITLLSVKQLLPWHNFFTWLGAMPIAAGDVISYSCLTALYSNVVSQQKQGKVMGLSFIVVGLGWTFSGTLGGFLMSVSPLSPLMLAPFTIIIALFLMHTAFGKKLALADVS